MDWLQRAGGLLEQYTGAEDEGEARLEAGQDFDRVAKEAPKSQLAQGIAGLFQSDRTPPFGQLVAQLFAHSNNDQRAGLLNTIISAVGPALVGQVLGQKGVSGLAGLLGGGKDKVTPEEAGKVPPEAVQEVAVRAQEKDPSTVDRLSGFLADHAGLIKSLGPSAVTTALSRMAKGS